MTGGALIVEGSCARAASGPRTGENAAPPTNVMNSRRRMETLVHTAGCGSRWPSRSKPELLLQIDFVPTDGTRLPIDRSGDFGASPFLGQLSAKQGA
jgi:hypothetical protein